MERRMITTDCHIGHPFELVDELPESYREHFPRLDREGDKTYLNLAGEQARMMMQRLGTPTARMWVDDSPRQLARSAIGNVCGEATPSFDPDEHLADLERDGVYGAVLIGRISTRETLPPEVDIAYCKVVNDWLAQTWGNHLDRVAPGIYLPYRDVDECVKEMERCAAMGLRPALLPDGIWNDPYHRAKWEPVWEAADSLNMPITMHVGGLRIPDYYYEQEPFPGQWYIGWYNQCCGMGETLGWLVFSGVFQRYPNLHVIVTEGYAGWLAFAMQFYDHHWSDSRFGQLQELTAGDKACKLDAPPSYYLKRQAHATFMWDPMAIQNRELTGLDCLMWGNDYPHNEGSFPFSREWVAKMFAGVPEHEIDQMVRGNAAKIFGIHV